MIHAPANISNNILPLKKHLTDGIGADKKCKERKSEKLFWKLHENLMQHETRFKRDFVSESYARTNAYRMPEKQC